MTPIERQEFEAALECASNPDILGSRAEWENAKARVLAIFERVANERDMWRAARRRASTVNSYIQAATEGSAEK